MAPPGKASAHVYYAANEPFDDWKGLKRGSPEYEALKRERAEPLWEALSAVIPDVRKRTEVELIASPLTHVRPVRSAFFESSAGACGASVVVALGALRCGAAPRAVRVHRSLRVRLVKCEYESVAIHHPPAHSLLSPPPPPHSHRRRAS